MKTTRLLIYLVMMSNLVASAQQKNTGLVSIDARDKKLLRVIRDICNQTKHNYLFELGTSQKVKVQMVEILHGVTLHEALEAVLSNLNYEYVIEEDVIHIKLKPRPVQADPLRMNVTGIILDTSGHGIPKATIRVKGDQTYVYANEQGVFSMKGIRYRCTLVISSVGFTTGEFKYEGQDSVTCILQPFVAQIQPIEVRKGPYNVRRVLNTGDISTVEAAEIENRPVSDPLLSVQGRIPGILVNQTSGISGAKLDISIRGDNSLANGNSPLYVIDGMPCDNSPMNQVLNAASDFSLTNSLTPDRIESIDVLKDADATAIYGSRGANGVVLITSKKPKPGHAGLTANISRGIGIAAGNIHLMNTRQYIEMRNEALVNDHAVAGPGDYDINGTWSKTKYTDWKKVFIGQHAEILNVSGTLTGGDLNTQFLMGAGYRKETTPFPGGFGNKMSYMNFGLHHDGEDKKLNINLNAYITYNGSHLPQTDPMQKIYTAPNAPDIYNKQGQLNYENDTFENPMTALLQTSDADFYRLLGNFNFSYELFPGLFIRSNFGYNFNLLNDVAVTPAISVFPKQGDLSALRTNNTGHNQLTSWSAEPQVTYGWGKAQHKFDVLLGITFLENNQRSSLTTATGFDNDMLIENLSSTKMQTTSNYENIYRYNGIFARLGYNYDEKYILNLTARRDGSSRFGHASRYDNFYAIGAGWVFSKEAFFRNSNILTEGKLRGSIGKTGNDQFLDYQFFDTYAIYTGYDGSLGLKRSQLTNYKYRWEILNKAEVGVDLTFNNRYNASASFYRNRTQNQLVKNALPAITGYEFTMVNVPAVVENKGWEFLFRAKHRDTEDFKWTSFFNLTIPRNKLLSFPGIGASAYADIFAVGYPLDIKYVYKYKGINTNTGIPEFVPKDTVGMATPQDKAPVHVGPDLYGGFGTSVTYKGVTLDILFQFVKQTGYYSEEKEPAGKYLPAGGNKSTLLLDRWRTPGDNATYPRYSAVDDTVRQASQMLAQSDASIVDASYIRLKNVSLSWNLPSSWSKGIKMKSGTWYIQAQNLVTWTKFKGVDPETQRFLIDPVLPPQKVFVMGIRMGL